MLHLDQIMAPTEASTRGNPGLLRLNLGLKPRVTEAQIQALEQPTAFVLLDQMKTTTESKPRVA